jgi:GNAT superfamily N-acetyltransferase
MTISYSWRGPFHNEAINKLHAEAFQHRIFDDDWWAQVNRHSLGWVCATDADQVVGFVNVAWDGAVHAFILDTMVASTHRGRDIGVEMLKICVREARRHECEWLHVDFEEHLRHFYVERCGVQHTHAGLVKLA